MGLFTKDKPPENLIRTLEGHTGPVKTCAITPDDQLIVSASDDTTLRIWDVASGELRATLQGHTGLVEACAISADGSFVVSTSQDDTIRIWDLPGGGHRTSISGCKALGCAVSRDGSFIVTGGMDVLTVWDVATGQERASWGGHAPIQNCALSPDGSFAVAACCDLAGYRQGGDTSCLKVWDIASGWARSTLAFPLTYTCAVSSDGSFIVSTNLLGMVGIWKADAGEEVRSWKAGDGKDLLVSSALTPDDSLVCTGERMIKFWETNTGRQVATLEGHSVKGQTGSTRGLAVSSDGSFVVSAGQDGTLRIWDAAAALASGR